MEGLFDNLEGQSDSQNFEPLTSTLRFSPCRWQKVIEQNGLLFNLLLFIIIKLLKNLKIFL